MDVTKWCFELMKQEDWVILDTETTGLGDNDEIVEIAIVAKTGEVLLNQLVRPFKRIEPGASRVHGITDETVSRAPAFAQVMPRIAEVLGQYKRVLTYNADFDNRMLKQSARKADIHLFMSDKSGDLYGLSQRISPEIQKYNLPLLWVCVMKTYAEHWKEPGSFGGYRWQKLEEACFQQEVQVDGSWHRAAGDCQATLALIKALAGQYDPEQETRKRAIARIEQAAETIHEHIEAIKEIQADVS